MIYEGRRFSYRQMLARVNRLANAFDRLGVDKGGRVAIVQVNCNEHVESFFATAKVDGVYVPLNFRARADELAHMINDSGPTVLVVGARYVELVRSVEDRLESVQHFISLDEPVAGWHYYDELVASAGEEERFPEADGDDLAVGR